MKIDGLQILFYMDLECLGVDNLPVLMVLTFTSTILFSSITYKWIEKPFMDYAKEKKGLFHHYKLLLKN